MDTISFPWIWYYYNIVILLSRGSVFILPIYAKGGYNIVLMNNNIINTMLGLPGILNDSVDFAKKVNTSQGIKFIKTNTLSTSIPLLKGSLYNQESSLRGIPLLRGSLINEENHITRELLLRGRHSQLETTTPGRPLMQGNHPTRGAIKGRIRGVSLEKTMRNLKQAGANLFSHLTHLSNPSVCLGSHLNAQIAAISREVFA